MTTAPGVKILIPDLRLIHINQTGPDLPRRIPLDISGNLAIDRSNEPLGMALVAALAVHAFLILSISFDVSREKPPAPERTLDITLVQPKVQPKLTENPDFLAQQSQEGGGEETIKERQTSPLGNPEASPISKPAMELERSGTPEPTPIQKPEIITAEKAPRAEPTPPPKPKVKAKPKAKLSQLLA
ncbi:MAG: hypothetical protein KJN79_07485, partial [Gammaproteobacteria bacterium]|nr:hypothetical protein [Gammaproteobacteria bacterium]